MGPGDEADDGRWWHARAAMTGSVPFRLIERGWVAISGAAEPRADEDPELPGARTDADTLDSTDLDADTHVGTTTDDDAGTDPDPGPDTHDGTTTTTTTTTTAAATADPADPVWILVWPPTAPPGLADAVEPPDPVAERWPELRRPRETPWTSPTTLTSVGDGWRLEHGATDARPADPAVVYPDDAALTADLERIECWPMGVDEWHRHRLDRLFVAVSAQARDDHYPGHTPTEPYASRLRELQRHLRAEHPRPEAASTRPAPSGPRPRGDLHARVLLVDADAWASAERTRQAGGAGWDVDGRART